VSGRRLKATAAVGPYVLLDLGTTAAMSAGGYWPETGRRKPQFLKACGRRKSDLFPQPVQDKPQDVSEELAYHKDVSPV